MGIGRISRKEMGRSAYARHAMTSKRNNCPVCRTFLRVAIWRVATDARSARLIGVSWSLGGPRPSTRKKFTGLQS